MTRDELLEADGRIDMAKAIVSTLDELGRLQVLIQESQHKIIWLDWKTNNEICDVGLLRRLVRTGITEMSQELSEELAQIEIHVGPIGGGCPATKAAMEGIERFAREIWTVPVFGIDSTSEPSGDEFPERPAMTGAEMAACVRQLSEPSGDVDVDSCGGDRS